jgi:hypothetical protein
MSSKPASRLRDTQYVIDQGTGFFAPALRHLIGVARDEAERRDQWNDATLDLTDDASKPNSTGSWP